MARTHAHTPTPRPVQDTSGLPVRPSADRLCTYRRPKVWGAFDSRPRQPNSTTVLLQREAGTEGRPATKRPRAAAPLLRPTQIQRLQTCFRKQLERLTRVRRHAASVARIRVEDVRARGTRAHCAGACVSTRRRLRTIGDRWVTASASVSSPSWPSIVYCVG